MRVSCARCGKSRLSDDNAQQTGATCESAVNLLMYRKFIPTHTRLSHVRDMCSIYMWRQFPGLGIGQQGLDHRR